MLNKVLVKLKLDYHEVCQCVAFSVLKSRVFHFPFRNTFNTFRIIPQSEIPEIYLKCFKHLLQLIKVEFAFERQLWTAKTSVQIIFQWSNYFFFFKVLETFLVGAQMIRKRLRLNIFSSNHIHHVTNTQLNLSCENKLHSFT